MNERRTLPAAIAVFGLSLVPGFAAGQDQPTFVPGEHYISELRADDAASGFAAFPARYSGASPVEVLNPSGFQVHLTNADQPDADLVFPAGRLFDPPSGRHRIWIEGDWSITPFGRLVVFGTKRRPPGSTTVQTLPIVPAGRVSMAGATAIEADLQLRLLFAGVDPVAGLLRHELSRRVLVAKVGDGVLMPEGPVLAALWDQSENRYVSLSRPFTVRAERTISAPLRSPAPTRCDLVAYVDRPKATAPLAIRGLGLELTRGGKIHRPDVTVETAWGIYGFWYGLTPGTAVIGGGNQRLYLEPETLELVGGEIARFLGTASKRPFLDD